MLPSRVKPDHVAWGVFPAPDCRPSGCDITIGSAGHAFPDCLQCGLVSLTRSLAVYLGAHGIRTNYIYPGGIDSPMLRVFVDRKGSLSRDAKENALKEDIQKRPIPRLPTPENIAYAALYMASDEDSFLNRVILPADEGKIANF